MELSRFSLGQTVKVKGTSGPGGFTAYDLCSESDCDETTYEGPIQQIEPETRSLRLLDRDLAVPEDATIKNLLRDRIPLGELKPGDVIVAKGSFDGTSGFVPRKLKREQAYGFAIERIEGRIEAIDLAAGTVDVAGIRVTVTEQTLIRSS
jgi:hypothetical protein